MATHPWLAPRKQMLENYRLPSEGMAEANALFAKLEQLAGQSANQVQFEQQLAASTLGQEYNNLLTKYSQYYLTNGQTVDEQVAALQDAAADSAAKEQVKSMVERELHVAAVQAMPEELQRLKFAGVRALPVIGPIVQWVDNVNWIRRMFGKRQ